jgi:hypothetical protein
VLTQTPEGAKHQARLRDAKVLNERRQVVAESFGVQALEIKRLVACAFGDIDLRIGIGVC